jgi:ABC-2 type transport system permease protein
VRAPDGPAPPPGGMALRVLRIRRMVVKELRQLFRDPRTKRVIFVAPVIQLLLFGYAVNTDVRNVHTFVVDHDRTVESRAVVDVLTASGYFRVVGTSDRDGDALDALDSGKAQTGLLIPRGFQEDLRAGRSPAVQVLLDGSNSNSATVAQGYALRILASHGARVVGGSVAAGGGIRPGVEVRARAAFNPGLESRVYNVPGVIAVIVLLMCLLLTAMAVVRERELGTLDQLLVSPLTPGQLMLGKTLPVALVALLQMALVTGVAMLWFDIPFRGSPLALVVAAALYILAGLSFGLVLSTVSRTQQEAFLGLFLFFLPAIILSGFLYPVETMPPFFQTLTLFNPLRHFLEVVRDIFLKGSGIADLWIQFLVLAGMAGAGLHFATRRFHKDMA